jgi:5-methylcytosine-specific restriction endonuclease McrA
MNGGSYTIEQWQKVCDHYGEKCLCCGSVEVLTVDHVKPVSCGGSSNIDNLQPICFSCNASKQNKHIDYRPDKGEFAKSLIHSDE